MDQIRNPGTPGRLGRRAPRSESITLTQLPRSKLSNLNEISRELLGSDSNTFADVGSGRTDGDRIGIENV